MGNYNEEVGKRINKFRTEKKMTLRQLGDLIGLSESNTQRYEKGKIKNVDIDIIKRFAEALGVSQVQLLGWEDKKYDSDMPKNIYPIKQIKTIPIIGNIAAGEPIVAEERAEYLIANEFEMEIHFALKVKGDSMIGARINDGDIVFIRQQPDVEDGDIAAVLINGEATLKRVYKMPGRVQLRAENPKYSPKDYTEKNCDDFKILGKAVGFQSKL